MLTLTDKYHGGVPTDRRLSVAHARQHRARQVVNAVAPVSKMRELARALGATMLYVSTAAENSVLGNLTANYGQYFGVNTSAGNPGQTGANEITAGQALTLTLASCSVTSTTLTLTTTNAHNLVTGNTVTLSGFTGTGAGWATISGSYTVTVSSGTVFTVTVSAGTYTGNPTAGVCQSTIANITATSGSGTVVTFTVGSTALMVTGQSTTLSGYTGSFAGLNGTTPTITVASATTFTISSTLTGTQAGTPVATVGYGRAAVTWGSASAGTIANATTSLVTNIPSGTTVQYFSCWTAESAGTYGFGGSLSSTITFSTQGTLTVAVGGLTESAS